MEYIVLTQTEFFRQIDEACSHNELCPAYRDFTDRVIQLCVSGADLRHAVLALAFAETELQFHNKLYGEEADGVPHLYIRKALAFVHKMKKFLSTPQVPPLSNLHSSAETPSENPAPPLQWTGNAIDLVELIYGIDEMGCINNGNMPLKQLAPLLYKIFGVESKDCYRFYTDIKRRKNESRTYFLDRMQEKLNERMLRDDELDRMRR